MLRLITISNHFFRMAEKLFENQSDNDIAGLGMEVERFIREDANLTTAWVRTESHFGAGKFSLFKGGC